MPKSKQENSMERPANWVKCYYCGKFGPPGPSEDEASVQVYRTSQYHRKCANENRKLNKLRHAGNRQVTLNPEEAEALGLPIKQRRAVLACGHADWVKCRYCQTWGPPSELRHSQHGDYHLACLAAHKRGERPVGPSDKGYDLEYEQKWYEEFLKTWGTKPTST